MSSTGADRYKTIVEGHKPKIGGCKLDSLNMEEARFVVYRLGHLLIDDEHQKILKQMEKAVIAEKISDTEALRETLDYIYSSTVTHFIHEEEIMDRAMYPYREWHKRVHAMILKELKKLHDNFIALDNRIYAERFFADSLEKLISRHIDESDKQMVDWLNKA